MQQQTVTLRAPVAVVVATCLVALGAFLVVFWQGDSRTSLRSLTLMTPPSSKRGGSGCRGSKDSSSWDGPPRIMIDDDAPGSNPLWDYFLSVENGPVVDKWHPYFDVYHRYFHRFCGRKLKMLEIGVQSGGSIRMWQHYFGVNDLTHIGVDIDVYAQALFSDPPRVTILLGDQADADFWATVAKEHPDGFDIILDDGGHRMEQQINTFDSTWNMLKPGGVYICEDTATSMDFVGLKSNIHKNPFGGGYGKNGTWHEYAKGLADYVQGHYVAKELHPEFDPAGWSKSVMSVAFYDQMVVLEKGVHHQAKSSRHGTFRIPYGSRKLDPKKLETFQQQLDDSLKTQ